MSPRVPRQARSQRTRERLLVAGSAEFARVGYARTTTATIAEAADVATGSFYQYFRNKDELLEELAIDRIRRHADRLIDSFAALPTDVDRIDALRSRASAIVDEVWDHHAADPGWHAIVTERRHADSSFDGRCTRIEAEVVGAAARFLVEHGARTDLAGPAGSDATALASVLFAMVEGTVHAQVIRPSSTDPEVVRRTLVEAMLRIAW